MFENMNIHPPINIIFYDLKYMQPFLNVKKYNETFINFPFLSIIVNITISSRNRQRRTRNQIQCSKDLYAQKCQYFLKACGLNSSGEQTLDFLTVVILVDVVSSEISPCNDAFLFCYSCENHIRNDDRQYVSQTTGVETLTNASGTYFRRNIRKLKVNLINHGPGDFGRTGTHVKDISTWVNGNQGTMCMLTKFSHKNVCMFVGFKMTKSQRVHCFLRQDAV